MTLSTSGPNPTEFWNKEFRTLIRILNSEALKLERNLVEKTPTGVSSTLRQAWFVRAASQQSPVAEVANSQAYLLPVELGRQPGSGISAEGQESVAEWARVKLGLDFSAAKGMAFALSQKYKRQGRPAKGFIGLAVPGTIPSGDLPEVLEPISGSTLDQSFKRLRARLEAA